MSTDEEQKNTESKTPSIPEDVKNDAAPVKTFATKPKNRRRRVVRRERAPRSEYDQKIISIRRVTRVVAGGRRFSFSVAIVIGNKKGSVGVGIGKASDTALAIEKAVRGAKKNLIKVPFSKEMSIPHETGAKYCSSEVIIMPAPGRGLVAGSSVRTVLELAGIKNVSAKILSRSKNRLNNAQAAIKALRGLKAGGERLKKEPGT